MLDALDDLLNEPPVDEPDSMIIDCHTSRLSTRYIVFYRLPGENKKRVIGIDKNLNKNDIGICVYSVMHDGKQYLLKYVGDSSVDARAQEA